MILLATLTARQMPRMLLSLLRWLMRCRIPPVLVMEIRAGAAGITASLEFPILTFRVLRFPRMLRTPLQVA